MPARGDLSSRTEGRRRKAPQEGTRGGWWGVCRLWGFGGAAACVRDARARVGGGGAPIAVGSLSSRRPLTGLVLARSMASHAPSEAPGRQRCNGGSKVPRQAGG